MRTPKNPWHVERYADEKAQWPYYRLARTVTLEDGSTETQYAHEGMTIQEAESMVDRQNLADALWEELQETDRLIDGLYDDTPCPVYVPSWEGCNLGLEEVTA